MTNVEFEESHVPIERVLTSRGAVVFCAPDQFMNDNNRVIKSYVWHQDKCFFVSTIERDSSAAGGPRRYNETIVWEYNWKTAECGAMVWQDGDSKGSIGAHQAIVRDLFKDGRVGRE